jgi:hypothetical protein
MLWQGEDSAFGGISLPIVPMEGLYKGSEHTRVEKKSTNSLFYGTLKVHLASRKFKNGRHVMIGKRNDFRS